MPAKGKLISHLDPPAINFLSIMKKLFFSCGAAFLYLLISQNCFAQTVVSEQNKLDSVVVEAFRAGKNTPVTYSSVGLKELRSSSPVHSVPMVLSSVPSVVSTTEGGNGLGYSSLRIRGSDATRINVTLNGIALNDGESQQVFWVNIPSFTAVLQDIQVQRGVGTSVNGSGAFGASINMRTLFPSPEPYGLAEFAAGSYNTFMTTVGAGTGRSEKGLSFDFRFTRNSGDGYIRNAKTDLKSLFAAISWYRGGNSVRVNYLMGDQKSGITWEGISREQMELDRRFNPAGVWYDDAGNIRFYDNETDNYIQHHIQALYSRTVSGLIVWNTTLHFTKGDGYYENYKTNRRFSSYGLPNQHVGDVVYSRSDMILKQALDNNYIAFNSNVVYNSELINSTTGVSYSFYDGDHFGNIHWSKYNGDIPENYRWYLNHGYKDDFSVFSKAEVSLSSRLVAFADLQFRRVNFRLRGDDKDFVSLNWEKSYNFFNPKAGFSLNLESGRQFYFSVSTGRKEPGRADIKESIKALRADEIKPEFLIDYEMGYKYNSDNLYFAGNLYFMEYKNQLVPTGRLSETGYVIKENVKESYRRGVELVSSWRVNNYLMLDGNITLSKNIIKDYLQFVDVFDDNWGVAYQKEIFFDKTDISFSPSVTAMGAVSLSPSQSSLVRVHGKYVGKQYLDNTSDDTRSVPSYFVMGLNCSKSFELKRGRFLDFYIFIDNLLDYKYFSNGWIYGAEFINGSKYVEEGLYPQAGINFTAKMALRF